MLTLTSAMDTKRLTQEGTAPVWVLKMKFTGTGDVYLGERGYTITGCGGGDRTINGWIQDWGEVREVGAESFTDTPILASELSLPVIIPSGRSATGTTLFSLLTDARNAPEQTVVELYSWDTALTAATDPPLLIWSGTIIDWPWLDEDTIELQLGDPQDRLDKPAGTVITTALFSGADERALGQIVPIPFGTVRNAPALPVAAAAHNALALDAAAGATTLYCSNVNEQPAFPASGTLRINGADVVYSAFSTGASGGVTYRTFTVTALAAAVKRGALVLEKKTNNDYVIAPYAIKTLTDVYASRVRLGSWSLVSSSGYDYIRFRQHPLELMQVALATSVTDTIGVTNDMSTFLEQLKPTSQTTGAQSPGVDSNISLAAFAASTSPTEQVIVVTFDAFAASGSGATEYRFGLALESGGTVGAYTYCFTFTDTIGVMPRTITATIDGSIDGKTQNVYMSFSKVSGATYTFTYTLATVMKTVRRAGVTTKTGTVAVAATATGLTEQDLLNMQITWDGGGAKDDGSGTFTGTASALIELPADVIRWFLYTFMALPVASFATAAGLVARQAGAMTLAGVVMDKKPARQTAARMAFEAGCRLQYLAGTATLWDLRRAFAPARILPTDRLQFLAGERVSARPRRAPLDWIMNRIALLYDPDPMLCDADDAYRATVSEADAAPQTAVGVRERASLMRFRYVRSAPAAAAVAKLFRQVFGPRRELVEFEQAQDGLGLQAGDPVLVLDKMTGDAPGLILSVDHRPGNGLHRRAPAFNFLMLMMREAMGVFAYEHHTANDTLTDPADAQTIHDNSGAAGAVVLTLPAALEGMVFCAAVLTAQALRLDPNGSEVFTISFADADATSPVGSVAHSDTGAGKYIGCADGGVFLMGMCLVAGKWTVIDKIGAWDVEA